MGIQERLGSATYSVCAYIIMQYVSAQDFFFQLLPLGVATVNHLPPSHLVASIFFCHSNHLQVLLHYIHESSLL